MGIKSILSDIRTDKKFIESLPNINSDEFDKVILTRRSVRVFTDEDIPKDIINNSLDNALKAPTSSNLQTWEIYCVKSKKIRKKVVKACLSHPACYSKRIVCLRFKTRLLEKK